jgi:hypothetical protein
MYWTQNGARHRIDSTSKGTQPWMDWTQNGTQHRIDLTPNGWVLFWIFTFIHVHKENITILYLDSDLLRLILCLFFLKSIVLSFVFFLMYNGVETVPCKVERNSRLSPKQGWVYLGLSPFRVESIRDWVPSGSSLFAVESIRGRVHSLLSPFGVGSIRFWVHSGLSPFKVGSIWGSVHLGLSLL